MGPTQGYAPYLHPQPRKDTAMDTQHTDTYKPCTYHTPCWWWSGSYGGCTHRELPLLLPPCFAPHRAFLDEEDAHLRDPYSEYDAMVGQFHYWSYVDRELEQAIDDLRRKVQKEMKQPKSVPITLESLADGPARVGKEHSITDFPLDCKYLSLVGGMEKPSPYGYTPFCMNALHWDDFLTAVAIEPGTCDDCPERPQAKENNTVNKNPADARMEACIVTQYNGKETPLDEAIGALSDRLEMLEKQRDVEAELCAACIGRDTDCPATCWYHKRTGNPRKREIYNMTMEVQDLRGKNTLLHKSRDYYKTKLEELQDKPTQGNGLGVIHINEEFIGIKIKDDAKS